MNGLVHHFWVTLRLLGTTRGGLVALLALANCLPMVAMQMFSRHAPHAFAAGPDPAAFAFSLLFVPLARWSLGLSLGQRDDRTSAVTLPLGPRVRALAEALAVLVAVLIPAALLILSASVVFAESPGAGLDRGLAILGTMGAALGAMALPHLFLASLDREQPFGWRMAVRWLAAPALVLIGLSLPGANSLLGYCVVGVSAGLLVLARGPSPWVASSSARQLGPRPTLTRLRAASPLAALRGDFLRGLGWASLRGLGWGAVLAAPLLANGTDGSGEQLAIVATTLVVAAALIAGARPLGLSTRVAGSQWLEGGSFGRAWSVLPVPAVSVARAVYLHAALCSAAVLGACALVHRYWVALHADSGGFAGALLLAAGVVSLASIGIRSTTATGSPRAWQGSWILGGTAAAATWATYFLSAPSEHATFLGALQATPVAAAFVALALALGLGSALVPVRQLAARA